MTIFLQVNYLKFLHLNKSGKKKPTLHDFLILLHFCSSFKNYFLYKVGTWATQS